MDLLRNFVLILHLVMSCHTEVCVVVQQTQLEVAWWFTARILRLLCKCSKVTFSRHLNPVKPNESGKALHHMAGEGYSGLATYGGMVLDCVEVDG